MMNERSHYSSLYRLVGVRTSNPSTQHPLLFHPTHNTLQRLWRVRFFFGLERSDMGGMNAAAIPKDGAKQWNTVSKYVAPRECEYRIHMPGYCCGTLRKIGAETELRKGFWNRPCTRPQFIE